MIERLSRTLIDFVVFPSTTDLSVEMTTSMFDWSLQRDSFCARLCDGNQISFGYEEAT